MISIGNQRNTLKKQNLESDIFFFWHLLTVWPPNCPEF